MAKPNAPLMEMAEFTANRTFGAAILIAYTPADRPIMEYAVSVLIGVSFGDHRRHLLTMA